MQEQIWHFLFCCLFAQKKRKNTTSANWWNGVIKQWILKSSFDFLKLPCSIFIWGLLSQFAFFLLYFLFTINMNFLFMVLWQCFFFTSVLLLLLLGKREEGFHVSVFFSIIFFDNVLRSLKILFFMILCCLFV